MNTAGEICLRNMYSYKGENSIKCFRILYQMGSAINRGKKNAEQSVNLKTFRKGGFGVQKKKSEQHEIVSLVNGGMILLVYPFL